MIDGAYAPPLGAIAFQWHTKTKFVTDINLVNGTGALIVSKKEWGKIGASDQAAVKSILDAKAKDLTVQSRKENAESRSALQSSGLQIVTPDPAAVAELQEIGLGVQKALVGRLYSQELLDKVLALAK
jgi:TRAP-type C4-dicarboxylate transport system substrate-binding protein